MYQLGTIFGDAALFVLFADHETGNVLQEQQRYFALAAEFDEMGAFKG